jgi:hypothetical protein
MQSCNTISALRDSIFTSRHVVFFYTTSSLPTAHVTCDALQSIGDDDDAVEASSSELTETQEGFQPVFFDPRPLRNLRLVDEVDSMSPIMDFKVLLKPFESPSCNGHRSSSTRH